MEYRNLEDIDFDTIFHGFERAFSDYEIHFEKDEVRSMLKRRGYNPLLSFAAFDEGEIVAFTLNGTGMFNGVPTAYDTGTGTVEEYRGQGIAGKIFNYSLPYLKEADIKQYLLEVLQNNRNAIAVYRRMNFEITREFDCYRQTIEDINNSTKPCSDCKIESASIELIIQLQAFCDFNPSWQNSFESIKRGATELTCVCAYIGETPVGFCVFDPATGDLTQIAVKQEYRQQGIASLPLHKANGLMKTDFIKVLNINPDDQAMASFLKSKNIPLASKQYEMLLQL